LAAPAITISLQEPPSRSSSRSEAARAHRRPDERVRFDAGNCDEFAKASQECIAKVGYDRTAAATLCARQYEDYRECKRLLTEDKRKSARLF